MRSAGLRWALLLLCRLWLPGMLYGGAGGDDDEQQRSASSLCSFRLGRPPPLRVGSAVAPAAERARPFPRLVTRGGHRTPLRTVPGTAAAGGEPWPQLRLPRAAALGGQCCRLAERSRNCSPGSAAAQGAQQLREPGGRRRGAGPLGSPEVCEVQRELPELSVAVPLRRRMQSGTGDASNEYG